MGVTISEVYACEPDEDALKLIEEFGLMVNWWAEKARSFLGGPYEELRKKHYKEWSERWKEWNSQLIHTSVTVAYKRFKLSERPERRPKVSDVKVSFVVLHPKMFKLSGDELRVSTIKGGYAYVKLKPKNHAQRKLLEQAEDGFWSVGQVILTGSWAIMPFTAEELDELRIEAVSELLEG